MDEIIILSGKGGTGKTSVAAALAITAGDSIVIADCDVDAANMHLLLEPNFKDSEEFFSGILPEIGQEQCDQCGKCHDVCRFHAILFEGKKNKIDDLSCEGCGYCERICPQGAIVLHSRKVGKVFHSQIRTGAAMIHARLDPGAENSGKLVAKVKNDAREIAKKHGINRILVDGSPGIGCPVISSLSGASLALLITEPSLSALHDMKRLHDMLKHFRVPSFCILNKADLNSEIATEIRNWLHENNILLLAELSFDEAFVHAMVRKQSLVEFDEKYKIIFSEIWNKILNFFKNNK